MTDPAPPETDGTPNSPPAKDPAAARFAAITLVRMSGAVLVFLGLLITQQRIDLPWWLGLILTLFGVFDVFVMPVILARRWKSPN